MPRTASAGSHSTLSSLAPPGQAGASPVPVHDHVMSAPGIPGHGMPTHMRAHSDPSAYHDNGHRNDQFSEDRNNAGEAAPPMMGAPPISGPPSFGNSIPPRTDEFSDF